MKFVAKNMVSGVEIPVSIDYETIVNKPKINSVTLEGNKMLEI